MSVRLVIADYVVLKYMTYSKMEFKKPRLGCKQFKVSEKKG